MATRSKASLYQIAQSAYYLPLTLAKNVKIQILKNDSFLCKKLTLL